LYFVMLPDVVRYVLGVTVVLAALSDVRSRQIPNWLTILGIIAGFALHSWFDGMEGLLFAGAGFGAACVLFLPLFALRWLGGGDVKLMIAIGALTGWKALIVIFILDGIFGGFVAGVLVLTKGRLRRTFSNIGQMMRALLHGRAPWRESAELEAGSEQSLGMPRAVTIAAATLLVLWAL
jgi:prepilin peptidase CpaA